MRTLSSVFRVLDLFAGAGGLTEGLHQSDKRFRTERAVEMDLSAAATYRTTFGDLVYAGKIEDWLRDETVPEVDLVVGGPPCQGFSTLGKQDGEDARNSMWRHYAETVQRAKPKFFILENVPQFLNSADFKLFQHATSADGQLSDYTFVPYVLNAAHYGAAQARKRIVVVGRHRDLPDPGRPVTTTETSPVTVGDVLAEVPTVVTESDLPDLRIEFAGRSFPGAFKTSQLHLTRNYQDLSLARFAEIPKGGNRFDIPDDLLASCWRKHKSGSADVMGRLHWDRPSVTIRTEFFKPEKGRYLHPTENRAITHYEAALIQGFPEAHQWVGSKTAIARQIGNAVPIPLGIAIGKLLASALTNA
ncbi:DNA cytosine methyltransferase [Rhodococcus sp. MS16]|uniref:DNA cytosine methyltransferase n=1 Tax=unclassified Rhodococcus (in: high G+C Gram-positive bacteria) TaxID=192944 RepID=UPI001228335F|nr:MULTISPECIES: DNA cytosine methyltransferase [unclassified Rhodococcus (in: high G+C Gram-positive bacteria)]NRI67808.1 DNA cytosine methyltransferase [Rhodococcus sp. MS16]RZL22851.1 MAG: DNA cytosine methyltransferase [Rhodococcus sp. (in: high G+C Gram-positive bacteria)]